MKPRCLLRDHVPDVLVKILEPTERLVADLDVTDLPTLVVVVVSCAHCHKLIDVHYEDLDVLLEGRDVLT